jgi:hypothetical protein
MEPLIVTYHGNDFNQAIEEARSLHPNHRGAVIAIPKGMEWLLKGIRPLANNEEPLWQAKN